MLSPTRDDMKNFGYGSPEEARSASQKALHFWVGATSPLWAPFWLASSFGVGAWAAAQAFKRTQDATRIAPEHLVDLMRRPVGADVAGTVQDMVREGLIAPMQIATSAVERTSAAVAEQTPSPEAIAEQIKTADEVTDTAVESIDVAADTAAGIAAELAPIAEKQVSDTVAVTQDAADIVADASKATADVAVKASKTSAESAAQTARITAKVVPAVKAAAAASDTAMSAADAPKTTTPRRPRKG